MPAGLEALAIAPLATGNLQPAGKYTASAAVTDSNQSGAVQCSYRLAAAQAAEGGLHISGMLFKPLGRNANKAAAAAAAAAANVDETAQLLYAVAWQTSSSVPPPTSNTAPLRHGLLWSLGEGARLRVRDSGDTGGVMPLQSSLGLLQSASASRARPAVLLSSQLPSSSTGRSSTPQAAVSGLLRVAARESSGQHFGHVMHHPCAAQAAQLPVDSSDMFGVWLAGKCGWVRCQAGSHAHGRQHVCMRQPT